MSRIGAGKPREYAFGILSNLRVSIHDALELSSKNLFANPRFDQFTAGGNPEFWGELQTPPRLRGRNVYVTKVPGGRMTKQNTDGLIGIHRSLFVIDEPLVPGEPPPGRHALDNVRRASTPRLEAAADAEKGMPADANCQIAFCWVIGNPHKRHKRIITNPGPFSDPFAIAEGQNYTAILPERVPHESITGIAIAQKPPDGTTANAYIQEIIDVRQRIPYSKKVKGPYRWNTPAPSNNKTFVGAYNKYAQLNTWFGHSPSKHDFTLGFALLSWQFETDFGWSAFQNSKNLDYNMDRKNTALWCRPNKLPRLAKRWRIAIKLLGGDWYTASLAGTTGGHPDGGLQPHTKYPLYTGNPQKWPKRSHLVGIEFTKEDQTGIEAPDEAPAVPTMSGTVSLAAGKYAAMVTDEYDDGESRPSKWDRATTTSGQHLRVRLRHPVGRSYGNTLPNADLADRAPASPYRPLYWTKDIPAQIASTQRGWRVTEARASITANQQYASSDIFSIDPTIPLTLGYNVDITRYVGGEVGVRVRFYDASNVSISVDFTALSADGWIEKTYGPSGGGYDFSYPANTAGIKIEIVSRLGGSAAINLDADIRSLGLFVGGTRPSKRLDDETVLEGSDADEGARDLAEDHNLEYPETAYAWVIADYAGAGINAVEYYGPWDTELQQHILMEGFERPVEAGATYTVQVTADGRGLPNASVLWEGVFIDEDGDEMRRSTTDGLAIPNGNFTASLLTRTFTAPAGAVAWRVKSNTLGRGRLFLYKPQMEKAASATTWTAAYASPGVVTQIFETWCPGVAITARNGILSSVKDIFALVAEADLPTNTGVSVRVAFKETLGAAWGPWFTSAAAIDWLDVKRYVKVEATVTTTDLNVSPELFEYGIDVERDEAVLTRLGGSEFYGGIEVSLMPALDYPDNEDARRDRYGNERIIETFRAEERILEDATFTAFHRRGVEQANKEAATGDRLVQMEHRGVLYVARVRKFGFKLQTRETPGGFGVWTADNVDATIIETKDLK